MVTSPKRRAAQGIDERDTMAPVPLPTDGSYSLEEQVGFLLRQANQRHAAIFADRFGDMTPPQWAALAKLHEVGPCSQNRLGRLIAMDVATIKGVVDRLGRRGFIRTVADHADRRRVTIELTEDGHDFYRGHLAAAFQVSAVTLAGLTPRERKTFLILIHKLA